MQYRRLGKTELEVSQISMGALQLGGVPQDKVNEIINYGLEHGLNYIDTSRVYGDSEIKLGKALAGKREEVIISSKSINRDLKSYKNDLKTGLENLQTDYVDIYFIHDVSTQHEWQQIQDEGILDFLQEQKEKGRVLHPACSTHSLEIGRKMLETEIFEVVMLAYNPANTEVEEDLIPLAKSLDVGIIIMKPYAGGILTETGSEELGFSITAAESLKFAASHPDIAAVIPGLDSLEYMKTAINVAESPEITEAEREKIMEKVEIKSEHYCRGCGYCMPCPQGLDIPALLSLWNRREAFQGINWAQMHRISEEYEQLEVKADECTACNQCTEDCPYSLPVAELMDKIAAEIG